MGTYFSRNSKAGRFSSGPTKCRGPYVKGCPPWKKVLTPPPKMDAFSTTVTAQPFSRSIIANMQPEKPEPITKAFFIVPLENRSQSEFDAGYDTKATRSA